jgi:nucleoside-diphosphate-sugar epimerase
VLALGRTKHPPAALYSFADYLAVDIAEAVPKLEATVCIHCAGLASDKETAATLNKINAEGTKNVFENISCSHFIFLSSASVYPPTNNIHTEEEEIDEANVSAYGLSKLKAEQYLRQHQNKRISIIRPRAVYGLGDRILLPRLLRLKKGPLLITPAQLNYRISITNIENLLFATHQLIKHASTNTVEIYNVVDDSEQTFEKVISDVMELTAVKPLAHLRIPQTVLRFLGKQFPKSDINSNTLKYYLCHHQLSNKKIKEDLQIEFPHTFAGYKSSYKTWIKKIGLADLQKAAADLPWRF